MSNLVPCKSCKKDVARNAKVCPHCGSKNPTIKLIHHVMTFIVLAIIVGFLMNSCEEDKTPSTHISNIVKEPVKTNTARIIDDSNFNDLIDEMSKYYLSNIKSLFTHYKLYKNRDRSVFINWRNNEWEPTHVKKRMYFDDILEKNRRYIFDHDGIGMFAATGSGLSLISLDIMRATRENDLSYLKKARNMVKEDAASFKKVIDSKE